MAIIIILISISLAIAIGFLLVFYWNLRSGQYDDTYTPSVRMLFDHTPNRRKDTTVDQPTKNQSSVPNTKINKPANN